MEPLNHNQELFLKCVSECITESKELHPLCWLDLTHKQLPPSQADKNLSSLTLTTLAAMTSSALPQPLEYKLVEKITIYTFHGAPNFYTLLERFQQWNTHPELQKGCIYAIQQMLQEARINPGNDPIDTLLTAVFNRAVCQGQSKQLVQKVFTAKLSIDGVFVKRIAPIQKGIGVGIGLLTTLVLDNRLVPYGIKWYLYSVLKKPIQSLMERLNIPQYLARAPEIAHGHCLGILISGWFLTIFPPLRPYSSLFPLATLWSKYPPLSAYALTAPTWFISDKLVTAACRAIVNDISESLKQLPRQEKTRLIDEARQHWVCLAKRKIGISNEN